jgi:hypothetical protein
LAYLCIKISTLNKKNRTIPETRYVVDSHGQKIFVQLAVSDWENLMNELNRLETLLNFKTKLKSAFREVRQIKRGEKIGKPLNELLDEL